jgi:Flp pilus assembly protein TadD
LNWLAEALKIPIAANEADFIFVDGKKEQMTKKFRAPKNLEPSGSDAPARPSAEAGDWRVVLGVCIFLAAITFAVFGQTLKHGFVNYDDDRYVYENSTVTNGLTHAGVAQAFAHGSLANWDPLTTLSHMADCQFYGLQAGGHHLTNVLLHTASVILLFLALRAMTGALWRSAFVAALFAIHPLHVESVAWVSERKDTLSGFFFMLTLWAYVRYAKAPPKISRYLIVVLCFVCGLMSKSMLITLPFVLLLLDFWPLKRIKDLRFTIYDSNTEAKTGGAGLGRLSNNARLLIEKLPLVAISAGACVVVMMTQGGAVKSLEEFPFSQRLANAVVSVADYVGQMFWPAGLAVFYPYPEHGLPGWEVGGAALVLVGISAAAWWWRKTRPFLLTGWLWYVGMLVPVMGLVQAGAQAQADRYTYLPQIGLYVALTWLVTGALAGWRYQRLVLSCAGSAVIAALGVVAFIQTTYWRDSETLWKRTLACTQNNVVAHNNLGTLELREGHTEDAVMEFQKAVESRPQYGQAHANLATALLKKRRVDEAIDEYQKAVELQPGDANFWGGLGEAFLQRGRLDEAIVALMRSLAIQPNNYDVHSNLGFALFHRGQLEEATAQFLNALELKPDSVTVQKNLAGIAWTMAASPDASVRNGARAVELAEKVDRLSGGRDPILVSVLAAAYAEAGRFPEAISTAQRAQQLAAAQSNSQVAAAVQQQLAYYQSGRAYRDATIPVKTP